MTIKKYYCLLCLLLSGCSLFSQESIKEPWVKLGGYVRSDIFFDNRDNLNAINGLFLFYPLNEKLSDDGKDLHANPSLTLLSVSSRLNTTFRTPDVLNAKITGRIEFDFTVFSSSANLRLRHAYGNIAWKNSSLLFGQTWHPAFVESCIPTVLGLSTGAPFQEFNRSPQIRFTQNINRIKLSAAFVSQMDYSSPGPYGNSPQYMRQAIIPEFNLQLSYKGERFLVGVNGSVKTLTPRRETMGTDSLMFKATETLTTFSVKGFSKYFTQKMEIKASVTYGQNLFDYLMQGGYGVSSLDLATGKEKYTPLTGIYSWINFVYGTKWQTSLTLGYGYNMGTTKPLVNENMIWGRALDIAQMYRVVPSLFYNIGKIQLALEYELNTAYYGSLSINDGKVYETKPIYGHRIACAATFFF
ncbi:MAG: hypothetical protein LBH92_06760 [Bacteroidales bacterium]|jgi:hypothetical protein|nr:hypothetical protein [Bacteroidales bacterium]